VGKRSTFERRANDAYDTWDARALPPLLRLLPVGSFVEPCAGNGTLIDAMEACGHRCVQAFDVEPRRHDIERADATTAKVADGSRVVTNPPWSRPLLHAIIENLAPQAETWLLFDAGWAFTRQAAPLLRHCHRIVVVGRLRWIAGTKFDAQDDCAWYHFGPGAPAFPHLVPRG